MELGGSSFDFPSVFYDVDHRQRTVDEPPNIIELIITTRRYIILALRRIVRQPGVDEWNRYKGLLEMVGGKETVLAKLTENFNVVGKSPLR